MNFQKLSITALAILLVACGKQNPVTVVDGFTKKRDIPQNISAEDMAYNLQSEVIETSQKERQYYVHGGDKLEQIAKHFDVSAEAILARNNIKNADELPTGQYITIPNPSWKTSINTESGSYRLSDRFKEGNDVTTLEKAKQAASPQIVTTETVLTSESAKATPKRQINLMREHVLKPGENIYRLALKYRVSQFDILAANSIQNPEDLKPGMTIKIPPAGERVKGRDAFKHLARQETLTAEVPERTAVKAEKVTIPQKPKMRTNEALVNAQKPKVQVKAEPKRTVTKEEQYANLAEKYGNKRVNSKGMIWPAEGKVIRTFGQKGLGVNHSGINISLPANAPIYAAEGGTVLYSDDGLELYGNLILVKHKGGYVTAYAHNSKNLVKRHQKVAKGDLIAFAGNSGNVDEPQLHFEVRKNTQPINPLKVLPKN